MTVHRRRYSVLAFDLARNERALMVSEGIASVVANDQFKVLFSSSLLHVGIECSSVNGWDVASSLNSYRDVWFKSSPHSSHVVGYFASCVREPQPASKLAKR